MSVLERIKGMSQPVLVESQLPVSQDELELKLRRKAGVLAAFGLADKAIADTLFITLEQITAIKETYEFKESCSKQTGERAQRLIDLEEGWDAIETFGTAQVLSHLQHSRDPEYALRAALMANRAHRRSPTSLGKVIDASNVGNVITLTVNKNYVTHITNNQEGASHGIIEQEGHTREEIPRKASDISTPKRLSELLQIESGREKAQKVAKLAENLGVSLDELEQIMPAPD